MPRHPWQDGKQFKSQVPVESTLRELAQVGARTRQVGKAQIDSTRLAGDAVSGDAIADGSITTAKLADLAVTTAKLGNLSASTGKIADNAVTDAKLRQSAGFSVIGKTDTGTGNVADIAAAANEVLRRSGSGNLTFGTLVTANIGDDQVTYVKLQDVSATNRLLGRTTAGAGIVEELSAINDTLHGDRGGGTLHADATTAVDGFMSAADKTKLDGVEASANNYVHPNHSGDVTSVADGAQTIANDAVSNAKLRDSAALSVIGRSANSSGDPADIAGTDGQVLRVNGTTLGFGQIATAGITDANVTRAKLASDARRAENEISDPGTGAAIPVTANGTVAIDIADAAETNTLAIPSFIGQEITLAVTARAGTGERVVTVASAFNQAGNNTITLNAAGEVIGLRAIDIGGVLAWRVLFNDDAGLSTV